MSICNGAPQVDAVCVCKGLSNGNDMHRPVPVFGGGKDSDASLL